jgi:hypothetical protein
MSNTEALRSNIDDINHLIMNSGLYDALDKYFAAGEDVTMTEWHLDFEHEVYGDKKGNQVAVQHWKDGKVVREQFYSLY